jgi:DNA repair protein RadC
MKERAPRPNRANQPNRQPEHIQTSFLAPEDATFYAELTRLRHLMNELTARYGRLPRGRDGQPEVAIRGPRDVIDLLMPEMQELPHEEFRTVLLNTKNVVLDIPTIYKGTLNSSPIRVAEVFKPAILANAASFIAVHCHPSGDPTPSPEDVRVTAQLAKAGELLDIECLDHLIIGRGRYTSLKERGLGFG